jgi:hypothetical protein
MKDEDMNVFNRLYSYAQAKQEKRTLAQNKLVKNPISQNQSSILQEDNQRSIGVKPGHALYEEFLER